MPNPITYGGQAVIEGVMMRGRDAMAVAVRHPKGHVVVHGEPLRPRLPLRRWSRWPLIRGVIMLWDTLALGMRSLAYSANVALDEDGEGDEVRFGAGGFMWGTMLIALGLGIALFFVTPLLIVRAVEGVVAWLGASALLANVIEGLIRMGFFFAYVWAIGWMPDIRRVFAYHGAEHKTINAYEAGEALQEERVAIYSTAHPRCGTSFLLVVVVFSILVFALIGRPPLGMRILSRVILVPLIAGVSYELIKFGAAHFRRRTVRLLLAPGMALQALTTREPDASQVEVAIAALKRVLHLEQELASQPTAVRSRVAAASAAE